MKYKITKISILYIVEIICIVIDSLSVLFSAFYMCAFDIVYRGVSVRMSPARLLYNTNMYGAHLQTFTHTLIYLRIILFLLLWVFVPRIFFYLVLYFAIATQSNNFLFRSFFF